MELTKTGPAAATIAVCLLSGSQLLGSSDLRTVALAGRDAPGLGYGVQFATFGRPPVINRSGQTAFAAMLQGDVVEYLTDSAVFSEVGSDKLSLLIRGGDTYSIDDAEFVLVPNGSPPVLVSDTHTVFQTFRIGRGSGMFRHGDSGSEVIATSFFAAAPGVDDDARLGRHSDIESYHLPVMNRHGQVAFRSRLSGTNVDSIHQHALFSEGSGGGLALLGRGGQPAAGEEANAVYSWFLPPSINDLGRTTVTAERIDQSPHPSLSFYREHGNAKLQRIASRDDLPPLDRASSYPFASPAINNAGDILVQLNWHDPKSEEWKSGIFAIEEDGGLSEVFSQDSSLSTMSGPQPRIISLGLPVVNGSGEVAFVAGVEEPGATPRYVGALITDDGTDDFAIIARSDDPAFRVGDRDLDRFGPLALNGLGQIAFLGALTDSSASGLDQQALFAQDVTGEFQLVAATGGMLDVSDDPETPDWRTVESLSFAAGWSTGELSGTGNQDGRPSGFNDRGQLAFHATFTDGTSGVFVSSLVAVPEPGATVVAATLLTLGTSGLRSRR